VGVMLISSAGYNDCYFLSPGSLESPVSDFHDTESSSDSSSSSTSDEVLGLLLLIKENLGVYGEIVSNTIF